MPEKPDLQPVFDRLKRIMQAHTRRLTVEHDTPVDYLLNAGYSERFKRVLWFGAVKMNKHYVSYHLNPIYMFPDLVNDLSPALKKRKQGRACFNFSKVDETLFAELAALTKRSLERGREEGLK